MTTIRVLSETHHHRKHDAWHILFFNPFFWEQTGKHGLNLRRVCKDFKKDIPEQSAIEAAFTGILIRKVQLFRIFPLSVYDVMGMRSPLLFVDAFRLALKKTGGFEFCIAVMRDKGWVLWNSTGVKRETTKARLNSELLAGGITWTVTGPLFEAAISGRRSVESARVWRFDCFTEEIPHWQTFCPSQREPPRTLYTLWEYDTVLFCLHDAVGHWYKGINHDVLEIIGEIKRARLSTAAGNPICCIHHQHIAAKKFLFGVIRFRPWNGLAAVC